MRIAQTDDNRTFYDDETTDYNADETRDFPDEETATDFENENRDFPEEETTSFDDATRNYPDDEEFTNFDLDAVAGTSEVVEVLAPILTEIKAIEYFGVLTLWFLIGVVAASTAFKRW